MRYFNREINQNSSISSMFKRPQLRWFYPRTKHQGQTPGVFYNLRRIFLNREYIAY